MSREGELAFLEAQQRVRRAKLELKSAEDALWKLLESVGPSVTGTE